MGDDGETAVRHAADRLAVALKLALYDAHPVYASTSGRRGGIGGQALTQGCSFIDPDPREDWTQYDMLSTALREYMQIWGDLDLQTEGEAMKAELSALLNKPKDEATPMPSPDLPAIESRAAAATAELSRICRSGNDFRMSIPANPSRDSDLILAAALADGEALLARVRELEGEVAAKDGQLSKWIDEISAIRQLIRLRICPRNPDDDTSAQLKAAFTYADLISERQNERALKLERENGDLRRKLAKHGIEVPR